MITQVTTALDEMPLRTPHVQTNIIYLVTSLLVLYDQRRSTTGAGSRLLDAVVVQLRVVGVGRGPGQNGVSSGRRRHRGRVYGELRSKEEGRADR